MTFTLGQFGLGFNRSSFNRDEVITANLLRETLTINLLNEAIDVNLLRKDLTVKLR